MFERKDESFMLRITSGIFRGRVIHAPTGTRTRPTQARLRQALFNSLQFEIPDARVLDLFAGSGALGFEALSRGAREVVFVENSKPAIKLIEKNAEDLKVTSLIRILPVSLESAWGSLEKTQPFDLILADPPYAGGWERKLLEEAPWEKVLKVEGYFCLEWGRLKSQVDELPDEVSCLEKVREKNYGDSLLTTYRRKS